MGVRSNVAMDGSASGVKEVGYFSIILSEQKDRDKERAR